MSGSDPEAATSAAQRFLGIVRLAAGARFRGEDGFFLATAEPSSALAPPIMSPEVILPIVSVVCSTIACSTEGTLR